MTAATRVAIAVVESAGRLLVGVRPKGTVLAGKSEFPGGKCEADETPRSCVVRECREETGLVVVPRQHLMTVTHTYDHGTVELHFWKCALAPDVPDLAKPTDPFRWVDFEELQTLDFPEANRSVLAMLVRTTAIIVVDHGSRRQASNDMLLQATQNFVSQSDYTIVEPAHMELAQPDIATAFRKCVERGANRVIVFPYFLSPGRHWTEDIPSLVAAAAKPFPEVEWLVTAPFGLHPDMSAIISDRIAQCLRNASTGGLGCDVCQGTRRCELYSNPPAAEPR
ncbi:MAG: CbiX/SirB N-terminal domain-containing protein [Planctomycetaceae bacterium]